MFFSVQFVWLVVRFCGFLFIWYIILFMNLIFVGEIFECVMAASPVFCEFVRFFFCRTSINAANFNCSIIASKHWLLLQCCVNAKSPKWFNDKLMTAHLMWFKFLIDKSIISNANQRQRFACQNQTHTCTLSAVVFFCVFSVSVAFVYAIDAECSDYSSLNPLLLTRHCKFQQIKTIQLIAWLAPVWNLKKKLDWLHVHSYLLLTPSLDLLKK